MPPLEHRMKVETRRITLDVDRDLSDDEQRRLSDVLGSELLRLDSLASLAPHVVHLVDPIEVTEDVVEDGVVVERAGASLKVEHQRCPDCGRLVIGGNAPGVRVNFLACSTIPAGPLVVKPCHPNCLVACGVSS